MQKQDASESLAFQLQLPGEESGDKGGNCRQGGNKQVVVRRIRKCAALGPVRDEVKDHGRDEQCDWKMNQNDVLGVFGKHYRSEIKRIWAQTM